MPAPTGSVLVAGSANLDFVVRVPHVPAPGETVLGAGLSLHPGGKGANQAVACARSGGADTRMLVALGEDGFAQPLEDSLQAAGVRLHVKRCAGTATGAAFIGLAEDAENAIIVAPGANALLAPEDLPPLHGVGHLLLQLETPLDTVHRYAACAREAGVTVVLNAAPAARLPDGLLELLDVVIVNEGELAAITSLPPRGADFRVAEALGRVPVPTVIVTLGARGICARHGDDFVLQAAHPVEPLDTTGAGDAFCGAFVAMRAQGRDLPQALRFASVAAALATTRLGAQSGMPERAEVEAALRTATPRDRQAEAALADYCGLPHPQEHFQITR